MYLLLGLCHLYIYTHTLFLYTLELGFFETTSLPRRVVLRYAYILFSSNLTLWDFTKDIVIVVVLLVLHAL